MKALSPLSALLLATLAQAQIPDITTSSGTLQGAAPLPNVYAYLGVPYAKAPVGDLRFAPPVRFGSSSNGKYQATNRTLRAAYYSSPGNFQPLFLGSGSDRSTGTAESEDMLSVNVWKPANATAGAKLPVLIFMHGGAFLEGANALPAYDARQLVAEQGIVVASINYRLNVFGYPNTPALATKNPGLLDQRMAVEWVRDNIAAFGGDAARITLSGHSAGAQSVMYWPYAWAQDPIVAALLAFSGQPATVPTDDGASWAGLVNTTGCANPSNRQAELACMRRIPPRDLKHAMTPNNTPDFTSQFNLGGTPVVDNHTVFPLQHYATPSNGSFARLPLLASHTTHEEDSVLPYDPVTGVNQTLSDELTLVSFHCPVAASTAAWAAQHVPVYRYLYNGTFLSTVPYSWMRPSHGADLLFVFANEERVQWQDCDETTLAAGRDMRNFVGTYVRDPVNGLAGLGWKRYNPMQTTLMRLFGNDTTSVAPIDPRVYDQPCAALAAAGASGV